MYVCPPVHDTDWQSGLAASCPLFTKGVSFPSTRLFLLSGRTVPHLRRLPSYFGLTYTNKRHVKVIYPFLLNQYPSHKVRSVLVINQCFGIFQRRRRSKKEVHLGLLQCHVTEVYWRPRVPQRNVLTLHPLNSDRSLSSHLYSFSKLEGFGVNIQSSILQNSVSTLKYTFQCTFYLQFSTVHHLQKIHKSRYDLWKNTDIV